MEPKPPHYNRVRQPRVLVVDDDPFSLGLLKRILEREQYMPIPASSGEDAWEVLDDTEIDMVIADRILPRMSALDLSRRMRANPDLKDIPLILMASSNSRHEICESIAAGVFFYLQKPLDLESMRSVLQAAHQHIRHIRELTTLMHQAEQGATLIRNATFEFHTLEEAEGLATLLARTCPDPKRHLSGIIEILINALEHGNLGIGYEDKTSLVNSGNWREEVVRRQNLPANQSRPVKVRYEKIPGSHLEIRIRDQGPGFNWKNYLEFDPKRVTHNHGRGIAMARAISLDELSFNSDGNEAVIRIHLKAL